MKRIRLSNNIVNVRCAKCSREIKWNLNGNWRSEKDERIAGICFMSENGDPVEAFDLCDECIGKLYSKLIY